MRIKKEFLNYEKRHLKLWNTMSESIGNQDIYSAYGCTDKSEKAIFDIWKEIQKLNCKKTEDDEFDKQCRKLIDDGNTAYLLKQKAVKKRFGLKM